MDQARTELDQALATLDQTVADTVAFFQAHADARGAAWGPKEVLSHLLFWHDWTLRGLRGVAAGQAPLRQPPTMAEIDRLNADAVASRSGQSIAALADELASLQRQLGAAARALPDPSATAAIRMDGSELAAGPRLAMMNHHIANHLAELRG